MGDSKISSAELIEAWKMRDLTTFKNYLDNHTDSRLMNTYHELLIESAKAPGGTRFVNALLSNQEAKNTKDWTDKRVKNRTALHLAVESGNQEVLKELLDVHADPNISDENGDTALHIVSRGNWKHSGHEECFKMLLVHPGIQINKKNKNDLTPFDVANSKRNSNKIATKLFYDYLINIVEKYSQFFSNNWMGDRN